MNIINIIHDYWTQFLFFVGIISGIIKIIQVSKNATKCSLRNDILQIYDSCKNEEKITMYQLQSVELSYSLYKKLKGNSFIDNIVKKMRLFQIID